MENIVTGNLHDTLKSLPTELLVTYYDDIKKGYFDEVDDIIKNIVMWELDFREEAISLKPEQVKKWRKNLEYSLFAEIAIRYGAIKTKNNHSDLVGFTELDGYVSDDEKISELLEDVGRVFSV